MTKKEIRSALKAIRSGEFSQAEVARLYGVSRQRINFLCKQHGIDMDEIRRKALRRRASQLKKITRVKTA